MRAVIVLVVLVALLSAAAQAWSPSDYSEAKAKRGAYFSAVTYCEPEQLSGWDCLPCQQTPGVTEAQVFKKNSLTFSSYGYVAYDAKENEIIVAFRGTDSISDWLGNVDVIKTKLWDTDVEVHEGFLRGYDATRDDWLDDFNSHLKAHSSAKILVVGHSLGGAQATLAGIDLKHRLKLQNEVSVITYGAPRVGTSNGFYEFFTSLLPLTSTWRIVHNHDIVPTLPPTWFGFEHIPIEVWYNADNTSFKVCDGSGEDPSCNPAINLSAADHHVYVGVPLSCDLTVPPIPDNAYVKALLKNPVLGSGSLTPQPEEDHVIYNRRR